MGKLIFHNEKELLSMLSLGNQGAFDEIYRQYVDDLYRYAYSRLGSHEDSEDLIQSVFTSLWERREHAKEITTLRYYLYCSVRYKLISRHKTLHEVAIRKQDYVGQLTTLDNSNQEHQNIRDTKLIIEHTIASLPKNVQTAFRLSREENLSNEKIAVRMNLSKGTVENYIAEALKSLRSSLGQTIMMVIWLNT